MPLEENFCVMNVGIWILSSRYISTTKKMGNSYGYFKICSIIIWAKESGSGSETW